MALKIKRIAGASGLESWVGKEANLTLTYDIWATTAAERNDPDYLANCLAFLNANTEPVLLGLIRGKAKWKEDDDTGHFLFDVDYNLIDLGESLMRWSFDTQGGTIRITNSRATARFPGTAPDHKGAIEVDPDGDVNGVDIVVPALKLTARKRWLKDSSLYNADTFMTYIRTLSRYTGQMNSGTYGAFANNELLFLGASGEFQAGKDNEVEYHFAASDNETALTIGALTGIAKNGHDYLWIAYKHSTDTAGKKCRVPAYAYVERVYDQFPFASLFGS